MAGQFGVDNFLKVADVVIEAGNVFDKIKSDKEATTAQKATYAMLLFDEVMLLPSVKFSEIKNELKELDAEDKAKLNTHFKAKFDIADDQVEAKIEHVFEVMLKLEGVVTEVIELVKSFKKVEAQA